MSDSLSLFQNEDKVALSPEVKLQALAAFSTLSKKMSKNISVEATVRLLKYTAMLNRSSVRYYGSLYK